MVRFRIWLLLFLAGSVILGGICHAEGDFPSSQAVKVASVQSEDLLKLPLAPDSLYNAGDAAMVYLQTEYENANLFIPVGFGRLETAQEEVCLIRVLERTDELSTANWVVLDQSVLADRAALYDQYTQEVSERIQAGNAGEARALLDEAVSKGVPERSLRELFQKIDISKVTTPDGMTFEQVVPDEALRKQLTRPEYLDATIAILNKGDWADPSERQWVLRSLPGRTPEDLAELLIVL